MKPAVRSPSPEPSAVEGSRRRPRRRRPRAAWLRTLLQLPARALAAGVQTFLAKPLDLAELVGAVAVLGGRPQPAR